MTAALALEQRRFDRAEQLQQLRSKMAAVSAKVGAGRRGQARQEDVLPAQESLLPIPDSLVELLPSGLPRGVVGVLTGARSLSLCMAAAVTAAGGHVAIVGQPDIGLLAAAEMGADLRSSRRDPRSGSRPGGGGGGADGWHGPGGARAWRACRSTDPGQGGDGARPAPGMHPAGYRRRLAGCVGATGCPGMRIRDDGRPAARVREDQPGPAGDARPGQGAHPGGLRCPGRVLAIWCMDWPAVAAAAAAGLPATAPVAVTLANRVIACSAAARSAGVRRGLRRRESQARCPQLHVVAADPARDARFFEGVTAAVDDLAPRAEVLRPGLSVLSVRGAGALLRFRAAAAEKLVDAVAAAGAECQIGIADELPTAVFAARAGRIVEPGGTRCSCPRCRSGSWRQSPACPRRVAMMWWICCGGWEFALSVQFAALSRADVVSRFGADAMLAHRIVRADPMRGPSGREPPPELDAVMNCDPPVDRIDAAAFAGQIAGRPNCTGAWSRPASDVPGWPSTPSPSAARNSAGCGGALNR